MSNQSKHPFSKKYWLDNPAHQNRVVRSIYAVCALLFIADLFYSKHPHFSFENWFGFYAWFGFFAYVGLVLLAKQWRKLVKRDEDYYDD